MKVLCVLVVSLALAAANPKRNTRQDTTDNYVSTASKIISSSVFKGIANLKTNYVFSPFGFASIVSILSEGARGQTLKEINEVMRFSDNIDRVRKSFSDALANLQNKDPQLAPQFKTWLYVYKNNSVDEYFKNTVRDFYYVEVKDIERNFYDFDDPKSSDFVAEAEETEQQPDQKDEKPAMQSTNSKDILEFESLKKSEPFDKDGSIEGFEDLKIDDIDDIKEASKFDKVVDQEKQYVEVPTIKKEIAKEKLQQKLEAENEVKSGIEKDVAKVASEVNNGDKEEVQDAPEKILLPLKKFDDFEIMQAVETKSIVRKFYHGRALELDGDVASALSANSLVGEKDNTTATTDKFESKMLLFNGLYYRGAWAHPFQQLRSDDADEVFHKSESEEQATKFMKSRAVFKYATVAGLNAEAIELPYENERYALLMVVPNKIEGLTKLMSDFTFETLSKVCAQLELESVQLRMPKFTVETTGRVEKALAKLGLITIFTSKADLSGVTGDQNLHVDELVQHVGVRVDEGSSSQSALTATNTQRSGANDPTIVDKTMTINRPFMFVVRDVIDDIILAAGKVVDVGKPTNEF